jgi:exopolysaccharide biosynthesis protein
VRSVDDTADRVVLFFVVDGEEILQRGLVLDEVKILVEEIGLVDWRY